MTPYSTSSCLSYSNWSHLSNLNNLSNDLFSDTTDAPAKCAPGRPVKWVSVSANNFSREHVGKRIDFVLFCFPRNLEQFEIYFSFYLGFIWTNWFDCPALMSRSRLVIKIANENKMSPSMKLCFLWEPPALIWYVQTVIDAKTWHGTKWSIYDNQISKFFRSNQLDIFSLGRHNDKAWAAHSALQWPSSPLSIYCLQTPEAMSLKIFTSNWIFPPLGLVLVCWFPIRYCRPSSFKPVNHGLMTSRGNI